MLVPYQLKRMIESVIRSYLLNFSNSSVITLVPNDWNTITHNKNTTNQRIFAFNGDYNANNYSVSGVEYINANSFRFYASGGSAAAARINWFIVGV